MAATKLTQALPILGKVAVDGELVLATDGNPYTMISYANGKGYYPHVPGEDVYNFPARSSRIEDMTNVDTSDPDFHQEVTVPLDSETHAAEEVEIFAGGPKAHLFQGVQEQNYIFHVMKDGMAQAIPSILFWIHESAEHAKQHEIPHHIVIGLAAWIGCCRYLACVGCAL